MEVGLVKIAEDSDFTRLKQLVDDDHEWKLEYRKNDETKVWTQMLQGCDFKRVKVHAILHNIRPDTVFDVLHDPAYRKEWDMHMIESVEIGYLNPNNDVGYYAISCPTPLKNRDFVLQRSWLDLGEEKLMINHSIHHKAYPPRKGFVRAISHLTGFVVRPHPNGCFIGYVSHTDPKGKLPPWLVNRITQIFAPKMVKQLRKAAEGYCCWKSDQRNPQLKPWVFPEQTLLSRRISFNECVEKYKTSTNSLQSQESDYE